jgi:hypothetical protein
MWAVVIHWMKYNMSTFLPLDRPMSTWARPDFAVYPVLLLVTSGISGCQVRNPAATSFYFLSRPSSIYLHIIICFLVFFWAVCPFFVWVHRKKTKGNPTEREAEKQTKAIDKNRACVSAVSFSLYRRVYCTISYSHYVYTLSRLQPILLLCI